MERTSLGYRKDKYLAKLASVGVASESTFRSWVVILIIVFVAHRMPNTTKRRTRVSQTFTPDTSHNLELFKPVMVEFINETVALQNRAEGLKNPTDSLSLGQC